MPNNVREHHNTSTLTHNEVIPMIVMTPGSCWVLNVGYFILQKVAISAQTSPHKLVTLQTMASIMPEKLTQGLTCTKWKRGCKAKSNTFQTGKHRNPAV